MRVASVAVLSIAISLSATAAVAADQFDLVCTGNSQGKPAEKRYHVDLKANHWCSDACTIQTIAQVEPNIIWFKQERAKFAGDTQWLEYVDRTNGKWLREMGPWVTEGTCEPAPFSGFPAAPMKF